MGDSYRSAAYTVLLVLFATVIQAAQEPVTLDDYLALSYVSSPQLAPDGSRLSYLVDGGIFVADIDGANARRLSPPGTDSWNVSWAADGKSIFFLSDRSGDTQLFRQPVDGDVSAAQISDFDATSASGNLSPDYGFVAFSVSDNELKQAHGEQQEGPIVVTRRSFRIDRGNGYLVDGDERHLYVHQLATAENRQLTSGPYDEGQASWAPNGETLVFVSNREDEPDVGYRTDLWRLNTKGDDSPAAITRLTDTNFNKNRPIYSPDGRTIAFLQAKDGPYGLSHLAMIPADGGDIRTLATELDRWVNDFQWSADGRFIYFRYHDSGAVNLARVRVADGAIEQIIHGDQVVGEFHVGGNGNIGLTMTGRNDAGALYTLADGELTQIADPNSDFIASRKLAQKSKVRINSVGDTEIDVFITTPAGFDGSKPYPAILNLHGGPQAQFTWGYGFTAQYFASRGYVVIEPNPRGSTGRGQEFLEANYRAWGVDDYKDVIAAVDYAVEAGIADPDKLAVTGYSYGGYLTNVAITEDTRFKAAAAGAGESHAEANFGHNVYTSWYVWELGLPWENRELYDVHAPFLRVGNVETPTLFMGGSVDWNQPILSAEMMYQALRIRGIDTQLIVYPDVHHGGWSAEFDMDYYRRIVDWFDTYIKPGELE